MTLKQVRIRVSGFTSRNKSSAVKVICNCTLKHAYEDWRKVLKKTGKVK